MTTIAVEKEIDKNEQYKLLQEENGNKIHISFSEFSKFQNCGHQHLIEKYLKLVPEEIPSPKHSEHHLD